MILRPCNNQAIHARCGHWQTTFEFGKVNRLERWPFPMSEKAAEKFATALGVNVADTFSSGEEVQQ